MSLNNQSFSSSLTSSSNNTPLQQTSHLNICSTESSSQNRKEMHNANYFNFPFEKNISAINESTQESQLIDKNDITINCQQNQFWLPDLIEQLGKKVPSLSNSLLYMWDDEHGIFQFLGPFTGILPMNIKLDKFRNANTIYINFKPMSEQEALIFKAPVLPTVKQEVITNGQEYQFGTHANNGENQNQMGQINTNCSTNLKYQSSESGQQDLFVQTTNNGLQQNNGGQHVDQSAKELEKKPRKKKQMKPEKRIKERTIQEVIDKVAEWRKLHETGDKINLDKAANVVGISRKTLDDYNLQMRRARDFGFDFNENKVKKMGVLRKFVKSKQLEEQKLDSTQNENCRKGSSGEFSTTEIGQQQFSGDIKDMVYDVGIFLDDPNNNNMNSSVSATISRKSTLSSEQSSSNPQQEQLPSDNYQQQDSDNQQYWQQQQELSINNQKNMEQTDNNEVNFPQSNSMFNNNNCSLFQYQGQLPQQKENNNAIQTYSNLNGEEFQVSSEYQYLFDGYAQELKQEQFDEEQSQNKQQQMQLQPQFSQNFQQQEEQQNEEAYQDLPDFMYLCRQKKEIMGEQHGEQLRNYIKPDEEDIALDFCLTKQEEQGKENAFQFQGDFHLEVGNNNNNNYYQAEQQVLQQFDNFQ